MVTVTVSPKYQVVIPRRCANLSGFRLARRSRSSAMGTASSSFRCNQSRKLGAFSGASIQESSAREIACERHRFLCVA